jgi:transposase
MRWSSVGIRRSQGSGRPQNAAYAPVASVRTTSAYDRFRKWRDDGTWARLKREVIALAQAEGDDIDWDAQADSTIVRAHQHGAGARKGGSAARRRRHVRVWVTPAGD